MFQITEVGGSVSPVLSAYQVRSFVQSDFPGEDELLDFLIEAATARIESVSGVLMLERRYRISSDRWPSEVYSRGRYDVPLAPVRSLSVYVGGEDVSEKFEFRTGLSGSIRPVSGVWPGVVGEGIEIEVVAGFGEGPGSIPGELLVATQMSVLQMYRQRNGVDTSGLGDRIEELVSSWRRVRL